MDNFINISRLNFKATASGELDFLDSIFYAESKDRVFNTVDGRNPVNHLTSMKACK